LLEGVEVGPCSLALCLAHPLESVPKQLIAVLINVWNDLRNRLLLEVWVDILCRLAIPSVVFVSSARLFAIMVTVAIVRLRRIGPIPVVASAVSVVAGRSAPAVAVVAAAVAAIVIAGVAAALLRLRRIAAMAASPLATRTPL